MAKREVTLQNFAGGELSPRVYGRFDLPIYRSGARRMENFIAETQGPARFRTGTRFVLHSRRNKVANLLRFEFNDIQAYLLEFTDGFLRFYRDNGIITEDEVAITGITQANPGVVTSTAHGLSNGDEVFLEQILGMTEVNGKTFLVAGAAANTFQLTDIDGNNIDTTNFTAYSSAGVFKKIFELATPYTEANDLFQLQITQNADTAYIVHPFYEPRKLTRTGHTAWTLVLFTRTADPFTAEKVITGITNANPGVVTSVAHGFIDGQKVIIENVVGMTEVNSEVYIVANKTANDFQLTDIDGVNVDTTGFTAYGSAGTISPQNLLPSTVAFHESRLFYAGPDAAPDKFFGSRSPDNGGTTRYDDFTNGTDADHAVEYTIADAEVNKILTLVGLDRLLFAGTFGSEIKITGDTTDKAITPTSVSVRPINRLGVADIPAINKENIVIYVQRGRRTIRSLEFDALSDAFISIDRNLVADHITEGLVKAMAWQSGRPDILWSVKDSGELIGLTFKSREDVSGWHRHNTEGADKFLTLASMPRPTGFEQVWFQVERVINGVTRRYIEFFADQAVIPERLDFFTGEKNKVVDDAVFQKAMAETQKEYIHVDSCLTFDGTAEGVAAGAAITPAAVTGTSVIFSSNAGVFKSGDVGREIWKKAIDGVGEGRAEITTVTNASAVVCKILDDFDNIDAMAAGNWYLTTDTLSNLEHLEARTVKIVADGGAHSDETVSGGSITLDYQASKIHVGLGYVGFVQPMSIEIGGITGPSQTKPVNVYKVGIKFEDSLGAEFGTDIYNPEEIPFSMMPLVVGSPQPLFTGVQFVPYDDNWERDKNVYIRQRQPAPCNVQLLAIHAISDDD